MKTDNVKILTFNECNHIIAHADYSSASQWIKTRTKILVLRLKKDIRMLKRSFDAAVN